MSETTTPIREKKTETIIGPPPKMYNVIIRNNTATHMDFVVGMLTSVFNMSKENAITKMLEVHNHNRARIGPFTKDVAETRKNQCMEYAARASLPQNRELLTTIEPAP